MSDREADQTVADVSTENGELPEGWTETTLGEVAASKLGKMLDKAKNVGKPTPYLRNVNVRWFDFDLDDLLEIRIQDDERDKFSIRDGDVLICEGGEPGRAAVWRRGDTDVVFQKAIHRVRLPDGILPQWLVYRLKCDAQSPRLETYFTGSTIKHLTGKLLKQYSFPLPPLAEQKRIVAQVESLLSRASAAWERLAKVPSLLARLRQSVLAAACSGQLTADWREEHPDVPDAGLFLDQVLKERRSEWERERLAQMTQAGKPPKDDKWKAKYKERNRPVTDDLQELPDGWCWATVDQLASPEPRSMQSGPFGSNLLHSEFRETGILAIGIDNVLDGEFTFGKQHRINERKHEELKKYTARPLDVLITVMATVGRCCVVPDDIETAIITKHVYRITADQSLVLPHYLMQSLRGSAEVVRQIQERIRGQTRPGINGQILKETAIPLPPLSEQQEIVRRVESLFALARHVGRHVESSRAAAASLVQSILRSAFRGELVETEAELARRESRPYEPASELLARIRTERESIGALSTTTTKKQRHRKQK